MRHPVKATSNGGSSALMMAAWSGNAKSVKLLLPFSDVKATDKDGDNALDFAKINGRYQIVRLLQPPGDL